MRFFTPAYKRAGFATPYAYTRARARAKAYAAGATGKYNQDVPKKPEDFGTYYRVFLGPGTRIDEYAKRNKGVGGSRELHHLLVDVLHAMSEETYQAQYPRRRR